jgi:hypothetical protein
MFKEIDENNKVLLPREQTSAHIIETEDETNETSSERKGEINVVDVNDKLQLNNIEKGKSYCPTTMIEILIKRCLTLL